MLTWERSLRRAERDGALPTLFSLVPAGDCRASTRACVSRLSCTGATTGLRTWIRPGHV
jgi:hypothetical protein